MRNVVITDLAPITFTSSISWKLLVKSTVIVYVTGAKYKIVKLLKHYS